MISSVRYSKIPYALVVIDGGIEKTLMRPFMQASQRGNCRCTSSGLSPEVVARYLALELPLVGFKIFARE
jgi:hypothetical protein